MSTRHRALFEWGTIAVLASVVGIGWPLVAETGAKQIRTVGRRMEQDISKWDANHNGKLDSDEMETFRREKIRERQEQPEQKLKAAIEVRKLDEAARRTRLVPPSQLKQYDTNTNGLIDLDEWKVYRANIARQIVAKRAARLAATTNAPAALSTNAPPR